MEKMPKKERDETLRKETNRIVEKNEIGQQRKKYKIEMIEKRMKSIPRSPPLLPPVEEKQSITL